jgi:hypothetical protein
MRTADFSRILVEAIQFCGLDRDEISDPTFAQIRDFAALRLRHVWEYDTFPQVIKFQEVLLTQVNGAPAFELPADCGTVISIWSLNPLSTTRNAQLTFILNGTKAYLTIAREGKVWVEYRTRPPELFGLGWQQAVEYKVGSQAFFDVGSLSGAYKPQAGRVFSGNFYNCKVNNVNKRPSEHTDEWEKVQIPYEFAPYVARAVFADYLRSEGQMDSARIAEAEAQAFLDEEIDKISRQQGQIRRINFINPYS